MRNTPIVNADPSGRCVESVTINDDGSAVVVQMGSYAECVVDEDFQANNTWGEVSRGACGDAISFVRDDVLRIGAPFVGTSIGLPGI